MSVVVLLGAGLLLYAQGKAKPKGPKPELVILATTQSLGNLEPCHCVEGMLGGFPRRLLLACVSRAWPHSNR